MPEKKTITGVTFTRITGPLGRLRQQGKVIDWMPYSYARQAAKSGLGQIGRYDLYIFQRAGDVDGKLLYLIDQFHQAGKKLVWETDDDYTNEFRQVLKADAVSVAAACDALSVSTPSLREQMIRHMKLLSDKVPPVWLLQNCIDVEFWAHSRKRFRRTVPSPSIGLVGTPTHYDDWIMVKDVLARIGREYPQVHFVVGGFLPDYLQDLPNLHYLEPVIYEHYPGMVLNIDIGLAPLDPGDRFNWSKSAIKAMEYWSVGAAVVASDAKPYQRVYDKDRMFLARTEDDWYKHITALLDDRDLGRDMALAGSEWVRTHRNLTVNSNFWWDAYLELFK
jgi:glycosyltransferase involved in cell wall biosynthesis